jgi:FKBP-type peptidyl-prolyl cis-trans isomerase
MRRSVIIVAAVALASCLSSNDSTLPPDEPSDPATETFADNLHINLSQMTKTALGDYYMDLKVGTGAALSGPQVVVFSFQTFLKNGVLIDQQLGVLKDLNTVVRGLQDGMVGMQVGTERVIVVPSALALGRIGQPPIIPANATLVFDVILNQIP